tara:strand:- start:93 stop:794 length:702 start_codon:yes stop_codon:yes gene_type:complete
MSKLDTHQYSYDLKTVMTYSVAAYKQNDNEYVNGSFVRDNKNIILKHLQLIDNTTSVPEADVLADLSFVNEEAGNIADEIIKYYRGLTFKAMGGVINDFEQRILNIISSGTVDRRDIGIIASMPKSYFRSVARDASDLTMRTLSISSMHVGNTGSVIEGILNVSHGSFIQRLQCHVVNGNIDGNIVVFFTKHPVEHFGTTCRISGKVKRHQISSFHNGKETVLNYVKKVDTAA